MKPITSLLVVLLGGLLVASIAAARPPGHHGGGPGPGGMPCWAMAADPAAAARLDEKVAAMNAAQGDARIAAQAAVINELVEQHRAMHARAAQGACPPGCPRPDCPMKQGKP